MVIKFTVFENPVAKGRPRFYRKGRNVGVYTPQKTRSFESEVQARAIEFCPEKPLSVPLALILEFFVAPPKGLSKKLLINIEKEELPVAKKPDLDNYIKAATDPLNQIFWEDDKLIVSIKASKFYSNNPRIEYTVITLEE